MYADEFLLTGLAILVLAVPTLVGAILRGTTPRTTAITVMIGGVLVVLALREQPHRYSFETLPHVLAEVVDRYT